MNELNNNSFFGRIGNWINQNPGFVLGLVFGIILAVILFTLGIFMTILIIILVLIGYWFGRNKNSKDTLKNMVLKIFKKEE